MMMMMKGTREIGGRKKTGLWTIYPSGFGMGFSGICGCLEQQLMAIERKDKIHSETAHGPPIIGVELVSYNKHDLTLLCSGLLRGANIFWCFVDMGRDIEKCSMIISLPFTQLYSTLLNPT